MPGYYSEDVVRSVREANDIVDVISGYMTLERKGGGYMGLCPFHGEKTASFSVNQRDQYFHCFGCGAGGNVFTFLMKMENMTFPEALKTLADRGRVELPRLEMDPEEKARFEHRDRMLAAAREAANYYYYQLSHAPENSAVKRYLQKRGISEEYRKKFGLGYSPVSRTALSDHLQKKGFTPTELLQAGLLSGKEDNTYDRFFNRLMFPILDTAGRPIAFGGRVMGEGEPKYLNSPDSELFNKRFQLFGMSIAKRTRRPYLIMVEGYMDVLSLHQAGYDNAVASLGTALTREQANLMKRYTDQVLLCYDSDGAGTKAAQRAIPILEAAGLDIKVMQVPGSKDPDEFIKEQGAEAFEQVIAGAVSPIDFELRVAEKSNGSTVEGQIRTLKSMKEKLAQIPNDTEREIHIRDVAGKMKVSAESLRAEVEELRRTTGLLETTSDKAERRLRSRQALEEMKDAASTLLAALLRRPDTYSRIREYLSPEDFSREDSFHFEAASYVLEQLNRGAEPAIADLISRFEKVEDQDRISRILQYDIPEDPSDLGKFLTQNLKAVKQRRVEEIMGSSESDPRQIMEAVRLQKEISGIQIIV
ncbi:MAG: DNA primase [Lachnospiraceae bacterium]|nr:DNA primase [Lachnospiraceae bacterium]